MEQTQHTISTRIITEDSYASVVMAEICRRYNLKTKRVDAFTFTAKGDATQARLATQDICATCASKPAITFYV